MKWDFSKFEILPPCVAVQFPDLLNLGPHTQEKRNRSYSNHRRINSGCPLPPTPYLPT